MMWSSFLGKPKPEPEPEPPKRRISRVGERFGPPITAEEQGANLSELEQRLNREMKCHAGKSQVFIRSLLTGTNTTQPRIALKCHLRRDIGLKPEVFYEHIRDICCKDPEQCEAYRDLKERFVET